MKRIHTWQALLIAFFIPLLLMCGCASKTYSYSIVSSDVYLEGDYMRGPSPRAIDIELTLSKKTIENGVDVDLDYFGSHYHGTINNNSILWDKSPLMISDGVITKSTIERYNSGVKMKHSYRMNNYMLTGEIIQVYSSK